MQASTLAKSIKTQVILAKNKKMKNLSIIILIFLLTACGGGKKEETKNLIDNKKIESDIDKVVGIANIEPTGKILPLTSEINGIITEILVKANDSVKAGQILMMLDYKVETAQLAQAKSKLSTQQAVINSAKANVSSLQVRLANAKMNFDRNQNLFNGGAATQQTLDDSKFQYEQLQKDIQASEATIAQQQGRLAELQTDVNYFQTLLDRKLIKATMDGKILSIDTKIGTSVTNSSTLGDFAPAGNLMAITEIDELFANKIKIGQNAYIRPQGTSEVLAKGKVIFTAPYLKKKSLFADKAENLEDRRVREIHVELEKNDNILIGSRLECVILIK